MLRMQDSLRVTERSEVKFANKLQWNQIYISGNPQLRTPEQRPFLILDNRIASL
ncbi:hypothetical protein LEP1GSC192_2756 [Leptospira sp. B5-022]|nr:hypothetical protein LEP1GSC192_2756 [Leptospira sp. B5-022]